MRFLSKIKIVNVRGDILMKAVILAGGYGTRLSEETMNQPKPMVTIGDRPIIWHIMKIFEHHGITHCMLRVQGVCA